MLAPARTRFLAVCIAGAIIGCARAAPKLDADWYRDAIGYEIFVRSFQDSDGDGIGDLRGLTSRLDYLEELGVNLLWLMPITDGPAWHGYEVRNYRDVDPHYGTLADFDALIARAHERRMHVILDFVANHSSSEHPWFVDASAGRDHRFHDYYVWSDHDLGWGAPWGGGSTWYALGAPDGAWYYGAFWRGMPDLNYRNPAVRAEIEDCAKFWLDHGADGFRLDAARYLVESGLDSGPVCQADTPETHVYWNEFRSAVERAKPNALLVGEIWAPVSIIVPYFGTRDRPELQMNFDFPGASGILNAIRRGDAEPARLPLEERLKSYPEWATAGSFLANHDQYRVATVLENVDHEGGLPARKLAAALLISWPGTPWLYYGEELGMRNGEEGSDDHLKRRPMQWTGGAGAGFTTGTPWFAPASIEEADSVRGQAGVGDSLLAFYRTMIALRKAHVALRAGSTKIILSEGSASEPLVLWRERASSPGAERMLLVFNFADTSNTVTIPFAQLPSFAALRDVLSGESVQRGAADSELSITVREPFGFRLYSVE